MRLSLDDTDNINGTVPMRNFQPTRRLFQYRTNFYAVCKMTAARQGAVCYVANIASSVVTLTVN
jgi:hypothetical protein